ncbi:AAA family ATPase [Bacterioplanoides sp.]|uniref:AAA family ATPase n=1 Tax=Bacterioplanoides sp. TaxID=2066072 RepID=UPI003B592723
MDFYVFKPGQAISIPGESNDWLSDLVVLKAIDWNDYGFYTTFIVKYYDDESVEHEIGRVRIGFKGQTHSQKIFDVLPECFSELGAGYFSLGVSAEYYQNSGELFECEEILSKLNDIVLNPKLIDEYSDEDVLNVSLLRSASITTVKEEYPRVLAGLPILTDFKFGFYCEGDNESSYSLEFDVIKQSLPPSNVHAVIGKNGVGKTTLFNRMVEAAVGRDESENSYFYNLQGISIFEKENQRLEVGYFSRVLSVSFSAFDTFNYPEDDDFPAKGPCYSYLGLIDQRGRRLKTHDEIYTEFVQSISVMFSDVASLGEWRDVSDDLSKSNNFNGFEFEEIFNAFERAGGAYGYLDNDENGFSTKFLGEIRPLLESLSSGHFIVIRIVVELLRRIETKTLVLIDEPETHLHPPLLSALIRIISKILHMRNGVAVVATHSPVVLQELPKSCVWKIYRTGDSFLANRPKIETYGENIGTLTEEVFGLDVNKSGFIAELEKAISEGESFDQIVSEFDDQLGVEARLVLKALISSRSSNK